MTTLEKFKELPHITYKYERLNDWGYCANLYHFDSEWHVTWIHCEDCDSLVDFTENTPEEAIDKAYDWYVKKFNVK